MQKRPPGMDVRVSKNSSIVLILPKKSTSIKASKQQRSQQQQTFPALPPHLNKLISEPWSKEASLLLDSWLLYVQQEFEIGGAA